MSTTEAETVRWVCPITARLHELEVTPEQADAMARGEVVNLNGCEHRTFSADDGIARLSARVDQIDARLDELVNECPALKAVRRHG